MFPKNPCNSIALVLYYVERTQTRGKIKVLCYFVNLSNISIRIKMVYRYQEDKCFITQYARGFIGKKHRFKKKMFN